MGLGNIIDISGISKVSLPLAAYGKLAEISKGKDSTTGHWELAGLPVDFDFSYYPNGFPKYLTDLFLAKTGCKGFLGNKPASGTEIISELGDEHCRTGFPIIYTSADSVFQIAAHEDVILLDRLDEICKITRNEVLKYPEVVGRVISRPFIGTSGNYTRTTNRHDYSLDPHGKTIFNYLQENSITTISIGKVSDLFNNQGIDVKFPTKSNKEGCDKLTSVASNYSNAFVFTNLVDFDVYYGHRNDPNGFANALKQFDEFLPGFISKLDESDLLILTADHGNDPTTPSTDHSREYIPLIVYGGMVDKKDLGVRETFADVGKSIGDFFNIKNSLVGKSFLNE